MLSITDPFVGTFIVIGGTTENSIGLEVSCVGLPFSKELLLEELESFVLLMGVGPQTTADCFAKLNSISMSEAPEFLKGRRNF
jgi:hypothetical protein